jgi:hypothetical protein
MRDQQIDPLNDDLAREIEQVLAVEPSPEFQARVRQRLAHEAPLAPGGWWRAFAIPAAALVVIVVGAVVGWQLVQRGERRGAAPVVASDHRVVSPFTIGVEERVAGESATYTAAPTPVAGTAARVSHGERSPVVTPPVERAGVLTLPPVVVADDELEGMRSLIATARAGGLPMVVVSDPVASDVPVGPSSPVAQTAAIDVASTAIEATPGASDDVDRTGRMPNDSGTDTARPPHRMALVIVRPIVIEPVTITPLVPPPADAGSEGATE